MNLEDPELDRAICELEIKEDILSTNLPIHFLEGNMDQARLCAETLVSVRAAIRKLSPQPRILVAA